MTLLLVVISWDQISKPVKKQSRIWNFACQLHSKCPHNDFHSDWFRFFVKQYTVVYSSADELVRIVLVHVNCRGFAQKEILIIQKFLHVINWPVAKISIFVCRLTVVSVFSTVRHCSSWKYALKQASNNFKAKTYQLWLLFSVLKKENDEGIFPLF